MLLLKYTTPRSVYEYREDLTRYFFRALVTEDAPKMSELVAYVNSKGGMIGTCDWNRVCFVSYPGSFRLYDIIVCSKQFMVDNTGYFDGIAKMKLDPIVLEKPKFDGEYSWEKDYIWTPVGVPHDSVGC